MSFVKPGLRPAGGTTNAMPVHRRCFEQRPQNTCAAAAGRAKAEWLHEKDFLLLAQPHSIFCERVPSDGAPVESGCNSRATCRQAVVRGKIGFEKFANLRCERVDFSGRKQQFGQLLPENISRARNIKCDGWNAGGKLLQNGQPKP